MDWQEELNAVEKYISNKFIYEVFRKYGFIIENQFIKLDSNINVYEACFISLVTKLYCQNYKKEKDDLNILEIGFAYGTSALMFLNQLKEYKNNKNYHIVDMNQTSQWKGIGLKNLEIFKTIHNIDLKYKLFEEDSRIALPKLTTKYDIIFIDGGHSYDIVLSDIINSDKLLKFNGIMILDDVLHSGVKNALLYFLKNNKNYYKIKVFERNNKLNLDLDKNIYDKRLKKRDYFNPNSMYAFIKL